MKCPDCGGPTVQLRQTGALVCARHCKERAVDTGRRLVLEETTASIARRLKSEMPPNVGFALVMYDFVCDGSMAYAGSGQRADTMHMLRELVDKMGTEGAPAKPRADGPHATSENCACCDDSLPSRLDGALICAFMGGVATRDAQVPIRESLCRRHASLADEVIALAAKHGVTIAP